jgi:hypothetical protein
MKLGVLLLSSIVLLFAPLSLVEASVLTTSGSVSITAIVPDTSGGNNGGTTSGGGGGGGGGVPVPQSPLANSVVFKGFAYPGSIVTLLKDAQIVAEVPASPDATFQISLSGVTAGTYNFGLRAQDTKGNISALQLYTINITSGVTTLVEGILISPTISIDKTEVRRGDVLTVFGKSVPNATISLVVNSQNELLKKTIADVAGGWVYKLDTLELEYGNHQAKARGSTSSDITPFSQTLSFKVGTVTKLSTPSRAVPPEDDFNNDQRINISDFSIMAYWYHQSNPPANVDLNHDGKVDLADFSILAYYWTG